MQFGCLIKIPIHLPQLTAIGPTMAYKLGDAHAPLLSLPVCEEPIAMWFGGQLQPPTSEHPTTSYIHITLNETKVKGSDTDQTSEVPVIVPFSDRFTFVITVSGFLNSITSYQTLPRNMPSHRAQTAPRYPEGYRTLPRNSMMRPDSICSVAGSVYDRALRPASTTTVTTAEKRRSMRDDTMWQLYEWQQRQAFSRQSLAQPTGIHTSG